MSNKAAFAEDLQLAYLDQMRRLHVCVELLTHMIRDELEWPASGHGLDCDLPRLLQIVQVVKGFGYSLCADNDAMVGMQQSPLAVHDPC